MRKTKHERRGVLSFAVKSPLNRRRGSRQLAFAYLGNSLGLRQGRATSWLDCALPLAQTVLTTDSDLICKGRVELKNRARFLHLVA